MLKNSEKKSYINTSILLNNAPKENDDYAIEAEILDAQVKSSGVNNIAVVAPYGAGKSSAIATYLNRYREKGFRASKHIQISLADFNSDEDFYPKQIEKADNENAIEQSILQQLLYNQKKHKLPNSSIQRTNRSRPLLIGAWGFLVAIFLLSLITLIFEVSGNGLFVGVIRNTSFIKPTAVGLSAVSLVILIVWFFKSGRLRSVKYKEFEISIDNNSKNSGYSLINKYIDEVLYFFECINVDLVIFEDLDRFDSLDIFVKLRELNTIINNSPKKASKVTFIYAVRDDMFADEKQRAKFFEFILPVVPVINPITTADSIREISDTLKNETNSLSLSEQFIKDISYFVSDMRVLKNAFNDYIIMANKLSDNSEKRLQVERENLFALALYKNLYPYDYSRLQANNGLIPLCVNKDKVVESFTNDIQNKISKLQAEKEKIKKEALENFDELKLIFKGQHYNENYSYTSSGTQNVDNIDTFKDITQLMHPQHAYYSVSLQNLPNGETYYERERSIKGKSEKRIQAIEAEIRNLSKEIDEIENSPFNTLISKIGIEVYFAEERLKEIKQEYREIIADKIYSGDKTEKLPEREENKKDKTLDKQIDFIRMLINKNYIDENYMEYISAYKSELSVNDRVFIGNVKKGHCKTYNYRLDNVKAVIRELNEEDFLQPAIIINDICKALKEIQEVDNENKVKTIKYQNLIRLFNSGKESVIKAVLAFLNVAERNEKYIFAEQIVDDCSSLIEALFGMSLSTEDKDMFVKLLIKANKSISEMAEIKQYINGHEQYTSLFKGNDLTKQCQFISSGQLLFEKLDVSAGRDRLFEYIVKNNMYVLNAENIRTVLNVGDTDSEQFERKNYTFIQQSNNEILKERLESNINTYIEKVFMKLPQSCESEDVVKTLLTNEKVQDENKSKVITHTDFKVTELDTVEDKYYPQLLSENKVMATWENVVTAYNVLGFDETLKHFIENNSGNIEGSFGDLDKGMQDKLFNEILTAKFDEKANEGLAKNIDVCFDMNVPFGKNDRIGAFILAGRFGFNIDDMRYLQNPPSTIPYLIIHQNKIKENMKAFFGNSNFKPLTVRNVVEECRIDLDFKKKFVHLCGGNFDISGIEKIVADFIAKNDCALGERLLYKFTNVVISADVKTTILSLTIRNNSISDFVSYRKYFCSIDNDYADFWNQTKKLTIKNTLTNRIIVEFMKKQNLISSFTTRKDKLHINCA